MAEKENKIEKIINKVSETVDYCSFMLSILTNALPEFLVEKLLKKLIINNDGILKYLKSYIKKLIKLRNEKLNNNSELDCEVEIVYERIKIIVKLVDLVISIIKLVF